MLEENRKEAIKLAVGLIEKETVYFTGKKDLLLKRNTEPFLNYVQKKAKLIN